MFGGTLATSEYSVLQKSESQPGCLTFSEGLTSAATDNGRRGRVWREVGRPGSSARRDVGRLQRQTEARQRREERVEEGVCVRFLREEG